ncbi:MAG: hypothetical protein HYY98_08595 [Burkholderiales bacterium]|jgi:type III secretion protein D|nr:hypothetical protein [Burkholderiales bacterium]
MDSSKMYELRVLSGEQRGAATAVRPGDQLRIGHGWSNDVVLQDGNGCATLVWAGNGSLVLSAAEGECGIAGDVLAPGEDSELALYTPFTVGGARMAVGRIGAPQWACLFEETPQAAAESATPDDASQAAQAAGAPAPARRSWTSRLLISGAALVGVSAGTLTLAWAMGPAALSAPEQAVHLRQALNHLGYASLNVESRDGQLLVTGHLDTQAQRSRLEKALADQSPARVAVWVNEQVSAGVADVFRLNGIAADVRASGPGVVRVHTREADVKQLEHVRDIARRDVPGLKQLVAVNDQPPALPQQGATITDPGKRVAAIVPGDPAYIVTADGTRYFEGAMLPSGHRIVAILPDKVQMERDGVGSVLAF